MNGNESFVSGFLRRGGGYVLGAGVLVKLFALVSSIAVTRMVDQAEYGVISFCFMLITPLIPMAGLALDFYYLRNGTLVAGNERVALYKTISYFGIVFSLMFVLMVNIGAVLLEVFWQDYGKYLAIFSLLIVFEYILRVIEVYLRVEENNREYSKIGLLRSIIMVSLVAVLVPTFGGDGYVVALVAAPLLVTIFFINKLMSILRHPVKPVAYKNIDLKYGVYIGIGASLSQLQIPMSGIIYGFFIGDMAQMAIYKVASIIPFSLIFIPNLIFKSEFVHLVKSGAGLKHMFGYLVGYWRLVIGFFTLGMMTYNWLGKAAVETLFGDEYAASYSVMNILLYAVLGSFLLRQPFGNILAALGYSGINVIVALLSTVVMIPIMIYLIATYDVIGAAYGVLLMTWVTGLILALIYVSISISKKALG